MIQEQLKSDFYFFERTRRKTESPSLFGEKLAESRDHVHFLPPFLLLSTSLQRAQKSDVVQKIEVELESGQLGAIEGLSEIFIVQELLQKQVNVLAFFELLQTVDLAKQVHQLMGDLSAGVHRLRKTLYFLEKPLYFRVQILFFVLHQL